MRALVAIIALCALPLIAVPASAADFEFCIGGICGDKHGVYPRESWEDRYHSWDEYCWYNWRDDPNCEEEGYFDEGFSPGPEWQLRHWHHRDHRDFHPAPAPAPQQHVAPAPVPPQPIVPVHPRHFEPQPIPHHEHIAPHHEFHGVPSAPHYEHHEAPHAPMPGSGSHPGHH